MITAITRATAVCALLLPALAFGFEPTFKRTVSGNDWFRTFQVQFPLAAAITPDQMRGDESVGLCKWRVPQLNGSMMGDMDPATGEFSPSLPNANFMGWLGPCIDQLAAQDLERAITAGKWASRLLENPAQAPAGLLNSPWASLAPADRLSMIKFQLKRLIGPGIVAHDDAWAGRVDQLLLARSLSVKDAYLEIVAWVVVRPEYLEY